MDTTLRDKAKRTAEGEEKDAHAGSWHDDCGLIAFRASAARAAHGVMLKKFVN